MAITAIATAGMQQKYTLYEIAKGFIKVTRLSNTHTHTHKN